MLFALRIFDFPAFFNLAKGEATRSSRGRKWNKIGSQPAPNDDADDDHTTISPRAGACQGHGRFLGFVGSEERVPHIRLGLIKMSNYGEHGTVHLPAGGKHNLKSPPEQKNTFAILRTTGSFAMSLNS